VIGAGAVGVEFASIFRSFGTEVTILEFLPRMVPVEDEEISKELARVFASAASNRTPARRWRRWKRPLTGVKVSYHRCERQAAGEGS
jgi:dihydrolipoamide dehydrogenase